MIECMRMIAEEGWEPSREIKEHCSRMAALMFLGGNPAFLRRVRAMIEAWLARLDVIAVLERFVLFNLDLFFCRRDSARRQWLKLINKVRLAVDKWNVAQEKLKLLLQMSFLLVFLPQQEKFCKLLRLVCWDLNVD